MKKFFILYLLSIRLCSNEFDSRMGTHLQDYWAMVTKGEYSKSLNSKKNVDDYQRFMNSLFSYKGNELSLMRQLQPIRIPFPAEKSFLIQEWDSENDYYLYFRTISRISQNLYPKLAKSIVHFRNSENVVIHYRLADVPFCRNRAHHLQYYEYYLEGLREITKAKIPFKLVEIITNFAHGTQKDVQELNELYLNDFVQFLKEKGYNVFVSKTGTNLEDFFKIVFASATISSTGCFSFLAALANKNFAYFPQHVSEIHPYKTSYFENQSFNANSKISKYRPVFHKEIPDYCDTQNVFKVLRKFS